LLNCLCAAELFSICREIGDREIGDGKSVDGKSVTGKSVTKSVTDEIGDKSV
jgi:hypothetical protein